MPRAAARARRRASRSRPRPRGPTASTASGGRTSGTARSCRPCARGRACAAAGPSRSRGCCTPTACATCPPRRARHRAAGAVDGRVERLGRVGRVDAFEDHRRARHRRADESLLAGERRGAALAHDPPVSPSCSRARRSCGGCGPRRRASRRGSRAPSPPPRRGPRRRSARRAPSRRCTPARLGVDGSSSGGARPSARRRSSARRSCGRSRASRSGRRPRRGRLVAEQVDVVVAAADRAELLRGQVEQRALEADRRLADLVEHRMVGALLVRDADAERDPREDLVHEARHVVATSGSQVGQHGLVAAADVVADAGRGDVLAVGDRAADRLRVAVVAVRAQHAARALLRLDAARELVDHLLLVLAEDPHRLLLQ
jgi:hypothetical protein